MGLIDMGMRLYDPTFGVFVNPDPLTMSSGRSPGTNPFAYADNNPVSFFDPTGLQAETIQGDDEPIEVIVYGDPLPWVPMWLEVPQPYYFGYDEQTIDYYPLKLDPYNPGAVRCNLNGQCSGGLLQQTFLAVRGDMSSQRQRQFQLTMDKLAMDLVGISAAKTLASNAQLLAKLGAGVEIATIFFPSGKLAGVFRTVARGEGAAEGTISVFHGSIRNGAEILEQGLNPARAPTFVSRDLAAAQDALLNHPDAVKGLGTVIESRIPASQFNNVLAPLERSYGGFYPYGLKSSEITLRSAEHIQLFNQYIIRF